LICAIINNHLRTVGNGVECGELERVLVIVAPPDGGVVAAANAGTGTWTGTQHRLSLDTAEVPDAVGDVPLRTGQPHVGTGVADRAEIVLGVDHGHVLDRVVVAGEVGVDFGELGVDVLDGAGDVDVGAVVEGLDVPGDFLDGVAWDGGIEGKTLFGGESLLAIWVVWITGWEIGWL